MKAGLLYPALLIIFALGLYAMIEQGRKLPSPRAVVSASRLQSARIACEIRNETQVVPGVPFQPELWVVSDADYEDASKLIGTWHEGGSSTLSNGCAGVAEATGPTVDDFALLDTVIATPARSACGANKPQKHFLSRAALGEGTAGWDVLPL